jgi:hypothetical protein
MNDELPNMENQVVAENEAKLAVKSAQPRPRCLKVQTNDCSWLFAWSDFISAHYIPQGSESEKLKLDFVEYKIVITGCRLSEVMDEVLAMRLDCVHMNQSGKLDSEDHGGPAIDRIKVLARRGPLPPRLKIVTPFGEPVEP